VSLLHQLTKSDAAHQCYSLSCILLVLLLRVPLALLALHLERRSLLLPRLFLLLPLTLLLTELTADRPDD